MSTEAWYRDPHNYVRELIEAGVGNIAWYKGTLLKRRIDPVVWGDIFFGQETPYRMLVIADEGTAEVGHGYGMDNPIAVYPSWKYGDELQFLEDMMMHNVGDDEELCNDTTIQNEYRPVFGQEHRVVVHNMPSANTTAGRSLIVTLKRLQEDYPHCILHVNGMYSYKYTFGMGFGAADIEPRTKAWKGNVTLASGYDLPYEHVQKKAKWVTMVGMTPADLEIPSKRCVFNIKSAEWAAENFGLLGNYANIRRIQEHDAFVPDVDYRRKTVKMPMALSLKAKPGDKTLCNMCSLKLDCSQFRAGEVCSLTDSNTGDLVKFFKTRDSRNIIEGLNTLLAMQAKRLETAMSNEEELDVIDPQVTKMVNSLFAQGVQLAKLVDPALRGGVKVNVGIVNGTTGATTQISGSTPAELTGEVVRALELQGIPRDKITPELVMATLNGMRSPEDRTRAIEGTIVAEEM